MKKLISQCIALGTEIDNLLQDYNIHAYAAQAAYFVMLSGIPVVMLAIIFVGAFIPLDMPWVNSFLQQFVPVSLHGVAAKVLDDIFNRSNIPLASVTTIFLLWAGSKGVRSIAYGIQNIYDSPAEHGYIKTVFYSLFYVIIFIVTVTLSIVILVFAYPLETFVRSVLKGRGTLLLTVINLRSIIFFVSLTFLFAIAYKTLAKSDISFFRQLPGAAIASGGWLIFSFGYSIYINYFSSYASLYGSLGALMLFMLWLYMCMNILLVGALINKLRDMRQ
ncbi:MAG: YihY/virulence factor BrkB family protein [Oscillospiraceae bacterium]